MALTATAQLRFDGAPMVELPCSLDGTSVFCAPGKTDAVTLADQLAKAKSVLVRFRAVGNLPLPVPEVRWRWTWTRPRRRSPATALPDRRWCRRRRRSGRT